jgi:hydroxyacylglutathione hydrolase
VRVEGFELGPFEARCVLLADDDARRAAIVDPGFEVGAVVATVRQAGLLVDSIVLTHAHLDHACGVADVKDAWPDARILLHAEDLPLYQRQPAQAEMFGFAAPRLVAHDGLLADGDTLAVGASTWTVRHCPGHSPGHIVLIGEADGSPVAVVGDVLFAGSIGRTDLWGGSYERLARSIREVLYALPDATRVVPGHGPETTIGEERRSNPFVPG